MVRTLEQAIAQIARLPDDDQERSAASCSRIEKLNALRTEIDKGIVSLDAGEGRALNIENFLREKNLPHGGA